MQTRESVKHATKASATPILLLGLLPWLAAWVGSYALHSAVAAFLLYHLFCLVGAWAYRGRNGPTERRSVPRGHWVQLAVAAVVIMGATYLVVARLSWLGWLLDPARIRTGLAGQHIPPEKWDYAALFLYFALVNPVAEELFWRATIYPGLRRAGANVAQAAAISALLFGSWHWLIVRLFFAPAWSVVITLGIIMAGAVFAMVYERTRSVLFSILLHALAADIPILLALWFGVLGKS